MRPHSKAKLPSMVEMLETCFSSQFRPNAHEMARPKPESSNWSLFASRRSAVPGRLLHCLTAISSETLLHCCRTTILRHLPNKASMFGHAKPSNQVEELLGTMSPLQKSAVSDHGSVSFCGGNDSDGMSLDSNQTASTRRAPLGEVQVCICHSL